MSKPTNNNALYLDHAATSWPKAPGVPEAMADAMRDIAGSPSRGQHSGSRTGQDITAQTRQRLADLTGEPDASRVIFTPGCTDALQLAVIGTVDAYHRDHHRDHPGTTPRVIMTQLEHNAIRRALRHLAALGRVELVEVAVASHGIVDPADIAAELTPNTALVCVLAVSNVFGTAQPIAAIAEAVRAHPSDALLLVDAAQAAGAMPLHDIAAHADYLAIGAHKSFRGPAGIGALRIGPRAIPDIADARSSRLAPIRFGGTGDGLGDDLPKALPRRFEPGTPNLPAIAGFAAALEHAAPEAVHEHKQQLTQRAHEALTSIAGLHAISPPDALGLVTFNIDGSDPNDIAGILDVSFGMSVRGGLQCSPGAHAAAGTLDCNGAVRASFGVDTTEADIDGLADAIDQIAGSVRT
ncbi:MAG: aminotransferase class V-fold PLP-dependent enzyme [Planctomycetota bacterium]